MKNYYEFTKLLNDKESIDYYNSLPNNVLNEILNNSFDDIDYYLNYYAEFLKNTFDGSDYDEHYYTMKFLSENINDIKIILNILKDRES